MLIYSILIQTILRCIIKVHLGVLLYYSIPACIAYDYHASAVSVAYSCLLLITSEIASARPLSYSRAYPSRRNPPTSTSARFGSKLIDNGVGTSSIGTSCTWIILNEQQFSE